MFKCYSIIKLDKLITIATYTNLIIIHLCVAYFFSFKIVNLMMHTLKIRTEITIFKSVVALAHFVLILL